MVDVVDSKEDVKTMTDWVLAAAQRGYPCWLSYVQHLNAAMVSLNYHNKFLVAGRQMVRRSRTLWKRDSPTMAAATELLDEFLDSEKCPSVNTKRQNQLGLFLTAEELGESSCIYSRSL